MSITEEELQALHHHVCEYKEMLVERFGVPTDMPPQLHVSFANGRSFAGQPRDVFWKFLEEGAEVFDLVGAAIRMLWVKQEHSRIVRVQLIAEGYMQEAPVEPDYRSGDFAKLFESGDIRIVESIGTYVADNDGVNGVDVAAINQSFTYSDDGMVRWGQPIIAMADSHKEGNIIDMLTALFADTERVT